MRKFLSWFLVVIMLVAMFPTAAFADNNTETNTNEENTLVETFTKDVPLVKSSGDVATVNGTGYSTLSEAVSNAAAGSTVIISGAVSGESITLSKSITLKGETGNSLTNVTLNFNEYNGVNIKLDGLNFYGSSKLIQTRAQKTAKGAWDNATVSLSISNCTIDVSGEYFIQDATSSLDPAYYVTLDFSVSNCKILYTNNSYYHKFITTTAQMRNVNIADNVIGSTDNPVYGFVFKFARRINGTNIELSNNIVYGDTVTKGDANVRLLDLWQAGSNAVNNVSTSFEGNKMYVVAEGTNKVYLAQFEASITGSNNTVSLDANKMVRNGVEQEATLSDVLNQSKNGDVKGTVIPPVCQIGDKKYSKVTKAIEEANEGDTITLIDDASILVEDETPFDITGITFDLNEKTLTVTEDAVFFTGKDFTIKNGTIASENLGYGLCIVEADNATVSKITSTDPLGFIGSEVAVSECNIDTANDDFFLADENSSVTVISGTYSSDKIAATVTEGSKLSITGGTFSWDVSDFAADGYYCYKNDEDKYVVESVANAAAKIGTKYYKTVKAALFASKKDDTVTLLKDASLLVSEETEFDITGITFDINGKTLTVTEDSVLFTGKDFTIKNGTIASEKLGYGLCIVGADNVIISKITSTDPLGFIDSKATVSECDINTANIDAFLVDGSEVTVTSGSYYSATYVASAPNGTLKVSGGTFSVEVLPDYLADGYYCYKTENGKYTVDVKTNAEAKIDDTLYGTVKAALKNAKEGETVKLIKNASLLVTEETEFDITGITFDLNGKTLTVPADDNLIFTGKGFTITNGTIASDADDYGILLIGAENATISKITSANPFAFIGSSVAVSECNIDTSNNDFFLVDENSSVTVTSGTYISADFAATVTEGSTLSITGGTFSCDVYDFAAYGYYCYEADDETFVVESVTNAMAKIGTKYYKTVKAALLASKKDDTVTLLKDASLLVSEETEFDITGITFDLNGKTLTVTEDSVLFTGKDFTITNGTIASENLGYGLCIVEADNVTVSKITSTDPLGFIGSKVAVSECNIDTENNDFFLVDENSSVTVTSGTYISADFAATVTEGSTLSITGGTFSWDVNEYCGDEYIAIEDNDNYEVVDAVSITYTSEGTTVDTIKVPKGTSVTALTSSQKPADPEKTGYSFKGWIFGEVTVLNEDITVAADFDVNTYTLTINYVSSDEDFDAPNTWSEDVDYGSTYSKGSPSVTGYVCDTTTVSGTMDSTSGVTVDVTYYKVGFTWNGTTSAKVNAGTVINDADATIGSTKTADPSCTVNGTTKYTATYEYQGQTFTDEKSEDDISAIDHKNKAHYDAEAATCLADGNIEYYYCPDCECYFKADMTATTEEGIVVAKLQHEYEFKADTDAHTITATCKNGCKDSEVLTLEGPTDAVYDGNAKTVTADKTTLAGETVGEITYKKLDAQGAWNDVNEAVNAGSYKAVVAVNGVETEYAFTIKKITPEITISCADIEKDGTPDPVCETKKTQSQPVITYSADGINYGTWDEVKGEAGTYYVKAYIAATENYDEAVATDTFKIKAEEKCTYIQIKSISEGRCLLYFNDKEVGYATLYNSGGKWAINVEGKGYIYYDGTNVVYRDTPYYWNYNGIGFYITKTEKVNKLSKKTKQVIYYLSYEGGDKGYPLTKNTILAIFMTFVTNDAHEFAYRDNGNGTHTKYCKVCGDEEGIFDCKYDESTHRCVCGHYDPEAVTVDCSISVIRTNNSGIKKIRYGKYTYTAHVFASAEGDDVKSIKCSTDGETWTSGMTYSQYSNITTLYVQVETYNSGTFNFKYDNGNTVALE